jgi:short-subunit dehydrogenase
MINDLSASGINARYASVDVGNKSQVTQLLKKINSTIAPLRGIIHAAGVLDDGIIDKQSVARFKSVMHGKALGAANLHLASLNIPLDFFVLFSSISSLMGSYGQANYAAANPVSIIVDME